MTQLARRLAAVIVLSTVAVAAHAQSAYPDPAERVLTHREQAVLVKSWIQKRFDTLLPTLMQRTGIDMWIIVSREYNDDPVFRSMAPLTTYSSRRRTILVFFNPGGGKPVERLSSRALRLRRPLQGRARRTTTRNTKGCGRSSRSASPR